MASYVFKHVIALLGRLSKSHDTRDHFSIVTFSKKNFMGLSAKAEHMHLWPSNVAPKI